MDEDTILEFENIIKLLEPYKWERGCTSPGASKESLELRRRIDGLYNWAMKRKNHNERL